MTEQFSIREMLEMILGSEGKRKLRLRHKGNEELFSLYESQLVLKHGSEDALDEAKRVLRHFKGFLGGYPPSPELAVGFLAQFRDRKPATLYRYLAIVKGFMSWYGEPITQRVKVPESLPEYIESEQIDRLKEALKDKQTHKGVIERNLLLVQMATLTGLRRGELAHLKVRDIDLDRAFLVVRSGKGQKDRPIDLTPSLTQSLRVYLKGKNPGESVFGLEACSISDIIRRASKKAGLSIHTHSLRDYFGQRLIDTGTDVEVVRRLLGHSSLNVTKRYLARTDSQRREAINRLEKPRKAIESEAACQIDSLISARPGEHPLMSWEIAELTQRSADLARRSSY